MPKETIRAKWTNHHQNDLKRYIDEYGYKPGWIHQTYFKQFSSAWIQRKASQLRDGPPPEKKKSKSDNEESSSEDWEEDPNVTLNKTIGDVKSERKTPKSDAKTPKSKKSSEKKRPIKEQDEFEEELQPRVIFPQFPQIGVDGLLIKPFLHETDEGMSVGFAVTRTQVQVKCIIKTPPVAMMNSIGLKELVLPEVEISHDLKLSCVVDPDNVIQLDPEETGFVGVVLTKEPEKKNVFWISMN